MKVSDYSEGGGEVNSAAGGLDVLMIVHGVPPASVGGAQLATLRLARGLVGQHRVTVLYPQAGDGPCRVTEAMGGDGVSRVALSIPQKAPARFSETYARPDVDAAFSDFLARRSFDLCHIHHLTGLSLGMPGALRKAGIPTIISLHDAWMACARGQLVDVDLKVCEGPSDEGCGRCLADQLSLGSVAARVGRGLRRATAGEGAGGMGRGGGGASRVMGGVARLARLAEGAALRLRPKTAADAKALAHRRTLARDALDGAALITAPSFDLLERFARMGWLEAPSAAGRVRRVDNPIPLVPPPVPPRPAPPLRLAFVGTIIPTKGLHVLLDALAAWPQGPVELTVVGAAPAFHRWPDYGNQLRARGDGRITWRGPLSRDEALAVVAEAHALVLPSIWPENASVILREALLMGVPVVGTAIGGTPEVVRGGVSGLLVPPGDAGALGGALRALLQSDYLARMKRGAAQTPPSKLGVEATVWAALYDEVAGRP